MFYKWIVEDGHGSTCFFTFLLFCYCSFCYFSTRKFQFRSNDKVYDTEICWKWTS